MLGEKKLNTQIGFQCVFNHKQKGHFWHLVFSVNVESTEVEKEGKVTKQGICLGHSLIQRVQKGAISGSEGLFLITHIVSHDRKVWTPSCIKKAPSTQRWRELTIYCRLLPVMGSSSMTQDFVICGQDRFVKHENIKRQNMYDFIRQTGPITLM